MHVVAYVISPIHVIAAIAAIRARHGSTPVRVTLAVHWPGVDTQHVLELHALVSDMTRRLDGIEACVAVPNDALNPLIGREPAEVAPQLRALVGGHDFAEIYYAHDVIGVLYAMLAQSYPSATRICFGDGLGNVYERHYHLGLLGIEVPKSPPLREGEENESGLTGYLRRFLGLAGRAAARSEARALSKLPFGLSSIPPHDAALILPIDQSGEFLRNVRLQVIPRSIVLEVLQEISASCTALQAHVQELLARTQGHSKAAFLLMTENNAEGNFMSFDRDVDMYCAIIARYCPLGSVIVLKSHPGETLPRNEAIRTRLSSTYEVIEFSAALKRYPIELAGDLVRRCGLICMSYPTLSLKYLFGLDVIQPTDDSFIEQWYPEQYWVSYKNSLALYSHPLQQLGAWDGRSLLWRGHEDASQ
jgi:hypothetical protein